MKRILFLVLLLVATTGVYGQKFAVKSNLRYDQLGRRGWLGEKVVARSIR